MKISAIGFWRSVCEKLLMAAVSCVAWSLLADAVSAGAPSFATPGMVSNYLLGAALLAVALTGIVCLATWWGSKNVTIKSPVCARAELLLVAIFLAAIDLGARTVSSAQVSALCIFLSVLDLIVLLILMSLDTESIPSTEAHV